VDVVKLITKGSIEEDMFQLGQTKLALDEAVAGEEGEEKVEHEMKTSLMNVVRKKLVDNTSGEQMEEEKEATTGGKPPANVDVPAETLSMDSPLSTLDDS